jgi:hypothetical protein
VGQRARHTSRDRLRDEAGPDFVLEYIYTMYSRTLFRDDGDTPSTPMLKALDAIVEVDPAVQPVGDAPDATGVGTAGPRGTITTPPWPTKPPGAGGYVPDVVVLLTDAPQGASRGRPSSRRGPVPAWRSLTALRRSAG